MSIAVALALGAVIVSLVALGVSVGNSIRIQRLIASGVPAAIGLARGAALPRLVLEQFLGAPRVDEFARGPTLIGILSRACEPCLEVIDNFNQRFAGAAVERLLLIDSGPDGVPPLRDLATFSTTWIDDLEKLVQASFQTASTPHFFVVREGLIDDARLGSDVTGLVELVDAKGA
jgi:hypothetical protein